MDETIAALWAETALYLWPDELVLASFAVEDLARVAAALAPEVSGFAALVVERDEVSVTLSGALLPAVRAKVEPRAVAGPFRAITLDLSLDLGVCGYLLPAAERLARAGISIVPQCAYQKDHLLVASERAEEAMAVLSRLHQDARDAERGRG